MKIVPDSWLSNAAMIDLTIAYGGREGTKNRYHQVVGRDIRENIGVSVCPGSARVVRMQGVLCLEKKSQIHIGKIWENLYRLSNSYLMDSCKFIKAAFDAE